MGSKDLGATVDTSSSLNGIKGLLLLFDSGSLSHGAIVVKLQKL